MLFKMSAYILVSDFSIEWLVLEFVMMFVALLFVLVRILFIFCSNTVHMYMYILYDPQKKI